MENVFHLNEREFRTARYFNSKLDSCAFINSIKNDIIKRLAKNRECLIEKINLCFHFWRRDDERKSICGNQTPIFFENLNFGDNGINSNDLMEKILIGEKRAVSIKDFDNKYIITEIFFGRVYDYFKILHKKKFHKYLRDELMVVAWHPTRYLDWCIDFEELRFLEEEVFCEE